jgi:hypothetical protein
VRLFVSFGNRLSTFYFGIGILYTNIELGLCTSRLHDVLRRYGHMIPNDPTWGYTFRHCSSKLSFRMICSLFFTVEVFLKTQFMDLGIVEFSSRIMHSSASHWKSKLGISWTERGLDNSTILYSLSKLSYLKVNNWITVWGGFMLCILSGRNLTQ